MNIVIARRRIAALAAAMAAAAVITCTAARAEFPEKPVTLVVPYAAGGSTETMARVFSTALEKALGQKVIVVTKPGAGGAVGATDVAKSDADGYTLLFAASTSLLWPPLTQNIEYSLDSFAYVGQVTEYQQAIIAKADAPFDTIAELIEYAKSNSLNFADQSEISRRYVNYIASHEGVSWTGIPTKGGGEMIPFLLGGKVDFAWSGGVHSRYADEVKVLASMNSTRLEASPDAPSIIEDYGISMPAQTVIVVPAGTSDDVVAKLESAVEAATMDAEFGELLTGKLKFPVKFVGSKALTEDIAKTTDALKKVIEATK